MKRPRFAISKIFIPGKSKYRNRLSVFFICMAISFFMWGLIKLSRVYEAPIKFKVQFVNIPDDKVLIHAEDTVVTLVMRARGLELYSKMFRSASNIIKVDLSNMRMRKYDNEFHGYVRTSRILKDLAEQLPQENSLIGVEPDTLKMIFQNEYRKKVPIKADLSISFAALYQLYDSVKLRPDSITVFGVKSVLDTIYSVNAENQVLKNLKESRLLTLRLIKPAVKPSVTFSADSITAEISVERFTESDIEVPISNSHNGRILFRTFPDKVKLTCRVAMKEYKRLDPSLFVVTIDHREAVASGSNFAEVNVTRVPSFAKVIRIQPERVEYLILK